MRIDFLLIICAIVNINVHAQKRPENFIFFDIERDRIHEKSFLDCKELTGAQLKYTWKELEPEKGNYDFRDIRKDLEFLTQKGKKLFIQIQDVSFDTCGPLVPVYLINETAYHNGVAAQCITDTNDIIIRYDGFVTRRWDPNVASRFYKLLDELGKEFDGKLEGINLPETAVDFG